ncbi:MAG: hypothetical protein HYV26_07660 [Candidatus Hydrogenedentes bacterium]|nr:hypothetical protein [Candidatus Hydrogenedentota bacterium]
MARKLISLWSAGLVIAFGAGVCCGAFFTHAPARAAQEFKPENVKSVPDSFVLGNNKNFAALNELLKVNIESQKRLEAIEKNTAAMVGLLKSQKAPR